MVVWIPRPGPGLRLMVYALPRDVRGPGQRNELGGQRAHVALRLHDQAGDLRDGIRQGLDGGIVGVPEGIVLLAAVLGARDGDDEVPRGGEGLLARRDGDLRLVGTRVLEREARRCNLELQRDSRLEIHPEVEPVIDDVSANADQDQQCREAEKEEARLGELDDSLHASFLQETWIFFTLSTSTLKSKIRRETNTAEKSVARLPTVRVTAKPWMLPLGKLRQDEGRDDGGDVRVRDGQERALEAGLHHGLRGSCPAASPPSSSRRSARLRPRPCRRSARGRRLRPGSA